MPVPPASPQAQECQERPVECQFCQLAVRLNKVDLHEHYCGQQTELCPDCGQHVMLRVLARHREECGREQLRLQKGEDRELSAGRVRRVMTDACVSKSPG